MSESSLRSPSPATPAGPRAARFLRAAASRLPGLVLCGVLAGVATLVGRLLPVVGGPVSGIVMGAVLAAVARPGERLRPGITTAGKTVLQVSVVLMGTNLSVQQITRAGTQSLPVLLGTFAVCAVAALLLGRRLRIPERLTTLVGVGTGICGASAIAAVTPIIGAAGTEVAYAVSTIFVFNIAAVIAFPLVGHLLGLGQHAFGLFAGTAVNDMSSVVAAATTYGNAAGTYAVVTKLTRTLLIIPVCLALAAYAQRRARRSRTANDVRQPVRVRALVPWFLVGFLLTAAANTLGLVPTSAHAALGATSTFLITVALSAIGLSTDLPSLRRAGPRPLLLGGALWVVVSGTSLLLQAATGLR